MQFKHVKRLIWMMRIEIIIIYNFRVNIDITSQISYFVVGINA